MNALPDDAAGREGGRAAGGWRDVRPLLALAAVGTSAGVGLGILTGRPNWPVYLVVVAAGGCLVAVVHRRFGLSRATLAGLVVFALAHVAGGMVPVGDGVLYQQWVVESVVRYDNLQQAFGFGVVGRATWEVRRRLGAAAGDGVVAWWTIVLAAGAMGRPTRSSSGSSR